MNEKEAVVTKKISDVTLAVTEGREVIVLKDTQAAIVFNDEGTLDLYFPNPENDEEPAGAGAILCITVARSVAEEEGFWIKRLDEVFDIAEELEENDSVSSDTEEPKGCGNHGCVVAPPEGQGTNGRCRCEKPEDTDDSVQG